MWGFTPWREPPVCRNMTYPHPDHHELSKHQSRHRRNSTNLRGREGKSALIYAVAEPSAAVYLGELSNREKALPHFTFIDHYSDQAGHLDPAYLESVVEQPLLDCLFMICGPTPLMEAMRTQLAEAGASARQIIVEDFEIR